MENTHKWPRCSSEMEEGKTKSRGGYARFNIWGQGGTSFWGTFKKNIKEITSYRCKSCGYLESYAEYVFLTSKAEDLALLGSTSNKSIKLIACHC
ncbi:MAG: hypothetical protein RLY61_509 [Candidatus Parcubacteria bacterium]|jgi:hypothetical protein